MYLCTMSCTEYGAYDSELDLLSSLNVNMHFVVKQWSSKTKLRLKAKCAGYKNCCVCFDHFLGIVCLESRCYIRQSGSFSPGCRSFPCSNEHFRLSKWSSIGIPWFSVYICIRWREEMTFSCHKI